MEDEDAATQLGGFALDKFISDFTGEASGNLDLSSVGLATRHKVNLNPAQIYNDNFEDDDAGAEGKDWEDEVDAEMADEYLPQPAYHTAVRGEDDDFDDEEEAVQALQSLSSVKDDDPEALQQQLLFQKSAAKFQNGQTIDPELDSGYPVESEPEITKLYPGFSKDKILNFTSLLGTQPPKKKRKTDEVIPSQEIPEPQYGEPLPSTVSFNATVERDRSSAMDQLLQHAMNGAQEDTASNQMNFDPNASYVDQRNEAVDEGWVLPDPIGPKFDHTLAEDWEKNVVIAQPPPMKRKKSKAGANGPPNIFGYQNPDVETGDWVGAVIWDPQGERGPWNDFTRLDMNLNDPEGPGMMQQRAGQMVFTGSRNKNKIFRNEVDEFNLSNDDLYEAATKDTRKSVRQTFGHLEVQHSYPATKLQLPWYKTYLQKSEARSFHRPNILFPQHVQLTFSKVRSKNKKRDQYGRKIKNADTGDMIRSTGELSLSDSQKYILCEFSEEAPPIMSNLGMGSILVNYYRKTSNEDASVPQSDLGEPFLIEPTDQSPFLRFGDVDPGDTVSALYNNLVRAPMFRHSAEQTDFLVCRTTSGNDTNYYIREIKNLFVVGQTYPLVEVPGPHSRKVISIIKARLQLVVYRLLKRSGDNKVRLSKIMKYFPDQTEVQMKPRLKEFMEYHRTGPSQGYYSLKAGLHIPDDQELLKMLSPESIALNDSMLVGQRHLQDAGYTKGEEMDTAAEAGKGDEDDSKMDIEQQLAPWNQTKNFLQATQNKAMLKLYGDGDPSGRGEAFSFIRISMKEIFVKASESAEMRHAEADSRPKHAHRYNVAEQQKVYSSEVDRIWRAQARSLSSKVYPELTEADEDRARARGVYGMGTPAPHMMTPGFSPGIYGRDSTPADMEDQGPKKILRIRRKQPDGTWKTEMVRDQRIIKAYLRQRQLIEEEDETPAEQLEFGDDEEKNKIIRKKLEEQLLKLKKNQERRLQRKGMPSMRSAREQKAAAVKAQKDSNPDANPPKEKKPKGAKGETVRKCGNCGQIGHMKTNRKCPMYMQSQHGNGTKSKAGSPGASSPLATNPPLSPEDYGYPAGSPSGDYGTPQPVNGLEEHMFSPVMPSAMHMEEQDPAHMMLDPQLI